MKKISLLLALLFVLFGCQEHPLQQLGLTSVSQKTDEYVLEGTSKKYVDILFVIDNSNSMKEEQEKVAQNVAKFMSEIKKKGDRTDYRIGVITTSVYTDAGNTQAIPNSGTYKYLDWVRDYEDGRLQTIVTQYNPPTTGKTRPDDETQCKRDLNGKKFLTNSDVSDIPENDIITLLSNTISCTSTTGANIERGFDAIEKSLSSPRIDNDNKDFLRENADLMIIVLSDEDDCSTGVAGETFVPTTTQHYCIEQLAPGTPGSDEQITLKTLDHYATFLGCRKNKDACDLCGNDATCRNNAALTGLQKVGFAAIVGPNHLWNGSIDDMGSGPEFTPPFAGFGTISYPLFNCKYGESETYRTGNYEEYAPTCEDCNGDPDLIIEHLYNANFGSKKTCSCEDTAINKCNETNFFTTCFNGNDGVPNILPKSNTDERCSEKFLNGNCDHKGPNYHCAVTEDGVKCEANSCSALNLNGTCSPGDYCNNGVCEAQTPAVYQGSGISYASPGKRYLQFKKLLDEKQSSNTYQYAICLQDFGTPLSLIGAKLADARCEYPLQNYTDDPCTLIINIAPPEGDTLPEGLNPRTSLGNPWTYIVDPEQTDALFSVDSCSEMTDKTDTYTCLKNICESDLQKAYSARNGVLQYLQKVECKDNQERCISILFPEETGVCPQPGSTVKIYYGVSTE